MEKNGMIDIATQTLTVAVTIALPFILMGYVRFVIRRALKTTGKPIEN
jgi:hypothetical protein